MIKASIVTRVFVSSLFLVACGDDESSLITSNPDAAAQSYAEGDASAVTEPGAITASSDGGVSVTGTSESSHGAVADSSVAPTYYEHVLPLFEKNCLGCHVDEGIGPMRLDDYSTAKTYARAIQVATDSRVMPPYLVTNDGSCGDFANAPYLSETDLQTIRAWVSAGAPEGTPRDVALPASTALPDTYEVTAPKFVPVAGGGALDAHDDYRCFVLDPPAVGKFLTGYQVLPGNAKIVHHVVVNLVDFEGPSDLLTGDGGVLTNGEVIDALDARDPDVLGYRCYGLAGEGVNVDSVPAVWAPGQAAVRYPNRSGIPVLPQHKLVVQIHYNLADHSNVGASDQTRIRFEAAESKDVPNIGIYLALDPMLNSLLTGGEPDTLAPGKKSVKYVWERTFEEAGLGFPEFELWGVFPHMHELGHKYTFEVLREDGAMSDTPDGGAVNIDAGAPASQCGAQVNAWDFHWQHLYFYREGQTLRQADKIRVTCDYDTTSRTEPVLPGWGTENEMCFAGMFVTVPNAR